MTGRLRRFAEYVSRGIVLKRRLPERFGHRPLYVTPESRLAYWRTNIDHVEPNLLQWADWFVEPGTVIWDIGANLGVFSLAAAVQGGPGGSVVALEPDVEIARLLSRSVALNMRSGEAPVTVLPVAASSSSEVVNLEIAARGRSSNYLRNAGGGSQAGGSRMTRKVLAVTLDWLVHRVPPPDLVKIDVEGAEAAVLDGARGLLETRAPRLLVEVNLRNRDRVAEILGELGYRFFDPAAKWEDLVEVPRPIKDTLCLPVDSGALRTTGAARRQ